jgi:hypothetical protein
MRGEYFCYRGPEGSATNGDGLYRIASQPQLRVEQHVELVDELGHDDLHHAGELYLVVGDGHDQRESRGNHHLYLNGRQFDGIHDFNRYCNCESSEQADDHFVYGIAGEYWL